MSRKIQYMAMASGAFGAISSGVNMGWSSPYLPYLLSPESHIPTTPNEGSWCAVIPLIGCPIGAFISAYLVNILGRKKLILLLAPIVFINLIWIAFAGTMLELIIARFIISTTEGAIYIALPIYFGEIADPEIRGKVGSSISVASNVGIIFINIIGPLCAITTSGLICSTIPIIHFITFIWMPESPYYHLKRGDVEAAKKSLINLRGHKDINGELDELRAAVGRQEEGRRSSFLDLLRVPSNRRGMLIYAILAFTNKFSGKNPLIFYTTTIFATANGSLDAVTSAIIFSSMGLVATFLALVVIDRFGRRPLILFSALGCALALSASAIYFTAQKYYPHITTYIHWLPIISLVCYNIIFSLGLSFGPVLYLSELFPTSIKAKAICAADSVAVIYAVSASKFFQSASDSVGMFVPFWTFAICAIFGFVLIYLYVPETKGKTLEQIQLELIAGRKI